MAGIGAVAYRNIVAYKWPKRHAYVIEECRALHVSDVLGALSRRGRARLTRWTPPTHPRLTLVARLGGPQRLWWFLCPTCRRRRETLYVPPGGAPDDWRCRLCHSLIYAVQRYRNPRHPLRTRLTHRKETARRKARLRQERQFRKAEQLGRRRLEEQAREAERRSRPALTLTITTPANGGPRPADASALPPPLADAQARLDAEAGASLATVEALVGGARSWRCPLCHRRRCRHARQRAWASGAGRPPHRHAPPGVGSKV